MNQVTTKELTVQDSIKRMEPEFKMALPAHIAPEKFVRTALTAINSNPALKGKDVDRTSLFTATMKAAQDGLVLDGREAALVTFRNKEGKDVAQYIPMLAGVLKKMRNSGDIASISYGLVYKKEWEQGRFEYIKGDSESLRHDPILFEDKGDMIGVYAVVSLKDGSKIREFMDMKQIAKVRASSRAKFGPWTDWFEEMCVKTVIKKVAKLCPQSTDIEQILSDDDEDYREPAPAPAPAQGPSPDVQPPAPRQTKAAGIVAAGAPPVIDAEPQPVVNEEEIPL